MSPENLVRCSNASSPWGLRIFLQQNDPCDPSYPVTLFPAFFLFPLKFSSSIFFSQRGEWNLDHVQPFAVFFPPQSNMFTYPFGTSPSFFRCNKGCWNKVVHRCWPFFCNTILLMKSSLGVWSWQSCLLCRIFTSLTIPSDDPWPPVPFENQINALPKKT